MTTSINKLRAEETALLRSLVGQEFRFVGGPQAPSYLVSDYFLIGASETSISIIGDINFVNLNDESGDYSFMRIHKSNPEEAEKTLKSGNFYLLNRRSKIVDVSVVTETISQSGIASSHWRYVVDIAVVLRLELGFVVFQLLSHNAEAISVESPDDFSLERFEITTSSFESDLVRTYRSELSLTQLV